MTPQFIMTRFYFEATVWVPFVPAPLTMAIRPEAGDVTAPSSPQLEVADFVLQLPATFIESLQAPLISYMLTTPIRVDKQRILNHARVAQILVPRLGASGKRYFFLLGSCDWEEEHGFEMLFCGSQILSCGPQEGLYLNEAWKRYISGAA